MRAWGSQIDMLILLHNTFFLRFLSLLTNILLVHKCNLLAHFRLIEIEICPIISPNQL